jgi:serine/threonine-protein kinase HipA
MNGEAVGRWYLNQSGTSVFQYDEHWPGSPHARGLSLSLPMLPGNQPHRGDVVTAWFDNLLPDSRDIRERLARRFRTGSTRTFDLLRAIGRDCVGAVQLMPLGDVPVNMRQIDAKPIADSDVARRLRSVTVSRGFGESEDALEDFRISIAGAQEKTALLELDGQWCVPRAATPTTHILKLPLGLVGHLRLDMKDSVENEWLCMHLLGALGFPVARTEIATFSDESGDEKVLVVERFDRRFVRGGAEHSTGWIVRLPQEDLCQALGVPPEKKYESDGGPSMATIMDLLRAGEHPERDVLMFAKAQLAFWLLAAVDGHAKNFSIFLRRHGYALTPLYDVLSAWPIIGHGPDTLAYQRAALAMSVRGTRRRHRRLDRITTGDWVRLASDTGVPNAFQALVDLVDRVEPAIARVEARLPPGFPRHVWTSITQGMRSHRERFLRGLAQGHADGAAC